MSDVREIRMHIKSVQDTEKVTSAMHMIASTKLMKAKQDLGNTRPYFDAIEKEIKRVLRINREFESRYFYPVDKNEIDHQIGNAYLIITADKGLAGSYNQEIIRLAEQLIINHGPGKRFVVGEYGRKFYKSRNIRFEEGFVYSAQNPTTAEAREIAGKLLHLFNAGEVAKLYVVYTDFTNGLNQMVTFSRLLPFHRGDFETDAESVKIAESFEFYPSIEEVLDNIVPSYVSGFIYSAMIDSYCSELNARMNAMDEANRNAEEILNDLRVAYNHARQNKITQEITEITAGAAALRKKQKKVKTNDRKDS